MYGLIWTDIIHLEPIVCDQAISDFLCGSGYEAMHTY